MFMNFKLLAGIFLILILGTVFSAAPTMGAITYTKAYATDYNYGNWITTYITLSSLVNGGASDLNRTECQYAIDGSWLDSVTDINADTNIYAPALNVPAATDDVNWCLKCMNVGGEYSKQVCRTIYADATAPVTVATTTSFGTSLTLTATDSATTTGNGAGVKRIYYKLDNAAWTNSATNPLTLTFSDIASHTILWYATDNLDNNEWVGNGDYWTKNWNTEGTDCSVLVWVVPLLCLLLAFWIIMRFMSGTLTIKELVGMAIAGIIGIYIIYAFSQGICVL